MSRWVLIIALLICASPAWGGGGGHAGFGGRTGHGVGSPARFNGFAGPKRPIGGAIRPVPPGTAMPPPRIGPHVIDVPHALIHGPGPGEVMVGPQVITVGRQPFGEQPGGALPLQRVMVIRSGQIAPRVIAMGPPPNGLDPASGVLPPQLVIGSFCQPIWHGYHCDWP
jgi:hypothetical protein